MLDITAEAEKYALDALKTLDKISKDLRAPYAARVSAAVAIIERAYGKAPQSIALEDKRKGAKAAPRSIAVYPMPANVLPFPKAG